jgi:hypothetical protein
MSTWRREQDESQSQGAKQLCALFSCVLCASRLQCFIVNTCVLSAGGRAVRGGSPPKDVVAEKQVCQGESKGLVVRAQACSRKWAVGRRPACMHRNH